MSTQAENEALVSEPGENRIWGSRRSIFNDKFFNHYFQKVCTLIDFARLHKQIDFAELEKLRIS